MAELIFTLLPLVLPVAALSLFLFLCHRPQFVAIAGIDHDVLYRLARRGVRWQSAEELAIKFIGNARLQAIVNEGYTDGRASHVLTVLRWYTPIGLAARDAVIARLVEASSLAKEAMNRAFASGFPQRIEIPVDLLTVEFLFNGCSYRVHDLQSLINAGSRIEGPHANLHGIPLGGVKLDRVLLQNGSFWRAHFLSCSFGAVTFSGCNLTQCTFESSVLAQVRFDNTALDYVDFSNSRMNSLSFDDKNMPRSVRFRRISYVQLLKFLLSCATHKDGRYFTIKDWFDPVGVDVHNLTRHDSQLFREYVLWCESNLGYFRSYTSTEKKVPVYNVVVAIATKFWSSFSALFGTIAIVIICFSCVYISISNQFANGSAKASVFDLVEYSFKTFVNAGFSDVKPLGLVARLVTVIEAVLGYISLGALIFLLNKRIEYLRSFR